MRSLATNSRTWLLAVLNVSACGGPADSVVEPGRLEFHDYKPMIDAPDTAAVGVPINVIVTTYGGGCISFESTDVTILEDGADIYVYDRRRIPGEDEACTLLLVYIPHNASLTFANSGNKVIHIHGRRYVPPVDEPLEIMLDIIVQ